MSDWRREIEIELERSERSQNPGRVRTAARRIAGIAIQELQKRDPNVPVPRDYITALRVFMSSKGLPTEVAAAASRLEARLSAEFTSPSVDPIGDAMCIVEFVKLKLVGMSDEQTGAHGPD